MRRTKFLPRPARLLSVSILAVASLIAAGCGNPEPDEIGAIDEPLVAGTLLDQATQSHLGLVAVYHPAPTGPDFWFPRPCSGIIIKTESGFLGSNAWVLTARHCVTDTNHIDGNPRPASQLRFYPAISPGLASPNPPAAAVPGAQVFAPDFPIDNAIQDLAVVRVQVNWSSFLAGVKRGLFVGHPDDLTDLTVTSYGYGIDQNLACDINNGPPFETHGAGIARFAMFKVVSNLLGFGAQGWASIQLRNPNTAGQLLICGDSGGPDLIALGPAGAQVNHVVGVHSTGIIDPANSALPNAWVQDQLGGVYLQADSLPGKDLDVSTTSPSQPVFTSAVNARTRFRYDFAVRTIISTTSNQCLGVSSPLGGFGPVQMQSCDSSAGQQWVAGWGGRTLVNLAAGTCLSVSSSGTTVVLAKCFAPFTSQRWTFSPQR